MKTKLIAIFILMGSFVTSYGQTSKEQIKDAQLKEKSIQKKDKALTDAISDKATKLARKESKRLAKEGWKVSAGALPLEKQLDETWKKQYERDENDYPKYIIANTKTIGTNYSAAKNQALNLAKVELAGLISTHVAGLVENTVANQDLSNQEAASIVKTIDASKSIIAQEMGRTVVLLEVYRVLPNKNTEVQIRIAYNVEIAMDLAKKTIVKKLEEEGAGLQSKLDGLLGMDKLKGIKNNSNVSEE